MPELTPKLGIKKPLGNETVSRAAFNENWDIIDANVVADKGGVPSIQAGLDANKPTPGTAGRLYVATDTQIIYRDTGSAWQKVGAVKWNDIDGKPASFTPSAHKNTHASGGADALAPADIGAASAADLASHLADLVTDADGVHGLKVEVGTFTPSLIGDSVAGSHTYTTRYGVYYKVGRLVFISIFLTLSAKDPNMAGNVYIDDLPFVSSTTGIGFASFAIGEFVNWANLTGNISAYLTSNSKRIGLKVYTYSSTFSTFVTASNVTNTSSVTISGAYLTT